MEDTKVIIGNKLIELKFWNDTEVNIGHCYKYKINNYNKEIELQIDCACHSDILYNNFIDRIPIKSICMKDIQKDVNTLEAKNREIVFTNLVIDSYTYDVSNLKDKYSDVSMKIISI